MKNEKIPPGAVACYVGAALFLGWAILKGSVIGFYPDELVVQILIPLGVAAVFGFVGKRIAANEDEDTP